MADSKPTAVELEEKTKEAVDLAVATDGGVTVTREISSHAESFDQEEESDEESEWKDDGRVVDSKVPQCLIQCCLLSWRSPLLPMVWLAAMFGLFWTCFGLVGELEREYDKISVVGCCGIIVDDYTEPSLVNYADGVSGLCYLSNLTGDDHLNIVESVEDDRTFLTCGTSLNGAKLCNEYVDSSGKNSTMSDCLSKTVFPLSDVCSEGSIEKTYKTDISDGMQIGFNITRGYCLVILFFILCLFVGSIYLWRQVPPSTKGGHTVFYIAYALMYVVPSFALVILVAVMQNRPCPGSWMEPYRDSGIIAIEPANGAQSYLSSHCAADNYPIFIDTDATLGPHRDHLDEICDQISGIFLGVIYGVLWPLLSCCMGSWITRGQRCMLA
jgi:hypothetical protein